MYLIDLAILMVLALPLAFGLDYLYKRKNGSSGGVSKGHVDPR